VSAPSQLSLIPRLHRATHAVALALAAEPELDVNQAEAHVLAHLRETRDARISELHRRFGHRRSTLTSVLDRLEERGLIERASDPDDRRSFVITLTADGRAVAARVHRLLAAIERDALDGLSSAQRQLVADALDAVGVTPPGSRDQP
jgi:DNA-binding MarR family transcriptional regulator